MPDHTTKETTQCQNPGVMIPREEVYRYINFMNDVGKYIPKDTKPGDVH